MVIIRVYIEKIRLTIRNYIRNKLINNLIKIQNYTLDDARQLVASINSEAGVMYSGNLLLRAAWTDFHPNIFLVYHDTNGHIMTTTVVPSELVFGIAVLPQSGKEPMGSMVERYKFSVGDKSPFPELSDEELGRIAELNANARKLEDEMWMSFMGRVPDREFSMEYNSVEDLHKEYEQRRALEVDEVVPVKKKRVVKKTVKKKSTRKKKQ